MSCVTCLDPLAHAAPRNIALRLYRIVSLCHDACPPVVSRARRSFRLFSLPSGPLFPVLVVCGPGCRGASLGVPAAVRFRPCRCPVSRCADTGVPARRGPRSCLSVSTDLSTSFSLYGGPGASSGGCGRLRITDCTASRWHGTRHVSACGVYLKAQRTRATCLCQPSKADQSDPGC